MCGQRAPLTVIYQPVSCYDSFFVSTWPKKFTGIASWVSQVRIKFENQVYVSTFTLRTSDWCIWYCALMSNNAFQYWDALLLKLFVVVIVVKRHGCSSHMISVIFNWTNRPRMSPPLTESKGIYNNPKGFLSPWMILDTYSGRKLGNVFHL